MYEIVPILIVLLFLIMGALILYLIIDAINYFLGPQYDTIGTIVKKRVNDGSAYLNTPMYVATSVPIMYKSSNTLIFEVKLLNEEVVEVEVDADEFNAHEVGDVVDLVRHDNYFNNNINCYVLKD